MGIAALILPGLDGSAALRRGFGQALQSFAEPVLVSYPPEGVSSYAQARVVVDRAISAGQAYVLVAESFSGPLACAIAGANPDGLRGLILCASFARYPGPWPGALVPLVRALPPGPLLGMALRSLMLGRWSTPARASAFQDAVSRLSPAILRSRLRAAVQADARSALASTAVPVLFLKASSDRVVAASAALEAQSRCHSMELRCVDGPHSLLQANPDGCSQEIRAFLRQL